MVNYLSSITGYINSFIYTMNYIGNHLSDYPGLITLLSLWVIIFAYSAIKKLCI